MPNYLSRMKPNGANGTEYKLKDEELREAFDVFKEDIAGTQTATGNPITLTDASETYAQGLSVELEPKQDLHGYDFPYVGGAGKNKLPLDLDTIKSLNTSGTWSGNVYTLNGVTFTILTDSDGNVTGLDINGTPSGNPYFSLGPFPFLGGTQYKLVGCPANMAGISVLYTLGGKEALPQKVDNGSGNVFTPNADVTTDIRIIAYNGASISHKLFKPCITLDTSVTYETVEQYANICPISGYEGVEVEDVGDNLFDKSTATLDALEKEDGSGTTSFSDYYTSDYMLVEPSTDYYLQNVAKGANWYCAFFFDNSKTFLSKLSISSSGEVASGKVTTPSNCKYLIICGKTSYIDVAQVTKGETAPTDYHPYQSRTASVTFGQTVYGGRSDFTEGGTSDELEIVDLGDLTWTFGSTANYQFTSSVLADAVNTTEFTTDGVYCEGYEVNNQAYSQYAKAHCRGIRNKTIVIVNDAYTDATTFKNAMAGIKLVYPKATPTTIATPKTDLKLLQSTNNLTTNGTTITLDYIPNNSIGDAVKASEEYTDRAVERVAVAPKATLIDTWMISEESDTISVDLTTYDCNFFLLEYLFQSKRGTTLIPRSSGGSFSASVVTYNNGTPYYIELTYNPTTKELAYTSNVTSQFGILAIYTI